MTTITRTRTSLPTFLREKGIEFSTDVVNGKMVWTVEGQQMSPAGISEKYGYTNQSRDEKKVCA